MDRSKQNHHHSSRPDYSVLRRTQTIASMKVTSEESSVSSLGSFAEADLVAQQFLPSKLSRQQTIAVDSPVFSNRHRENKRKTKYARSGDKSSPNQKQCPHCLREFSNSWAVPKHVQRIHDRGGEFHCPRCTFKTPYHEALMQHEKDAHRKCPYCRQLFVLLNKHVGTCPKRPRHG